MQVHVELKPLCIHDIATVYFVDCSFRCLGQADHHLPFRDPFVLLIGCQLP